MVAVVLDALLVAGVVALFVLLLRRVFGRRDRWSPGAGASGAIHELLIQDKRKAIEIILEERAEYTDPETKDGDLPQHGRKKLSNRTEGND
jgi:hypothetical protein